MMLFTIMLYFFRYLKFLGKSLRIIMMLINPINTMNIMVISKYEKKIDK